LGGEIHRILESQRGPYDLVRTVHGCGSRAVEVSDDLGATAGVTPLRPTFQQRARLVCAGPVGAVFSFDASRPARNGRNCHHFVDKV
jgi:hypothetical protein